MKKSRTVLFSLVLFIGGLLLLAVLFSLFQKPGPWKKPASSPGLYRKSEVEGLPHEHVPGATGVVAGLSVRINNLGFRGEDVSRSKPEGTTRIVIVGDSIVFGQGVDEEKTLSCLIEELLARKEPGRSFQVINAGVRGYNSHDYVVLLKEKVLSLSPDLVILVITEINDPERKPFRPESEKLERFKSSPWRKVPILRELVAASYADEINRLFKEHVKSLYDPEGEEFRRFREDIRSVKEICDKSSVELLAVTFPMLSEENMFETERARLKTMLSEEGVSFIDPYPLLDRYPAGELVVGPRDFHPNGKALEIVARALAGPVMQKTAGKKKDKD
ncbi:MAG: SGNH/GDSL hydrolase family protein [bacterium]